MTTNKKATARDKRTDMLRVHCWDALLPDPDSHLYDHTARHEIDPALVESIRRHGVKVPILAHKDPRGWLVEDGRRRVLHAREAFGPDSEDPCAWIPCVRANDKGADPDLESFRRMLLGNELRVDDSMLVRAQKFSRGLELGLTHKELCDAFGVTPQMGRTLLDLLNLSKDELTRLGALKISDTAKARIGRLSEEQREEMISSLEAGAVAGEKKPSTAAIEKEVRKKRGTQKESPTDALQRRLDAAVNALAALYDSANAQTMAAAHDVLESENMFEGQS